MSTGEATLVPHGTLDYAEMRALGLQPEELTLFSSNINPYGPSPAVTRALRDADLAALVMRYPDRLSHEVRMLLAALHGVGMDALLVGNGSADLLWLVGLLHLQRRRVVIIGPTFGEYHNVARIMAASVVEVAHAGWQVRAAGYQPSARTIAEVARDLRTADPDVVFICNPNNPTGDYLAPSTLEILYAAASNALWIVDEAYAEFMQPPATTAPWVERGNWLVVRSMTKDFALGGLRVGYLIGAPDLIAPLQCAQSPWNVNTLAQFAASLSLREGLAWRAETVAKLQGETRSLQNELWRIGYAPRATTVNYFLVPVHDPAKLRQQLLANRLVVRDCTSFGLPTHIRIATQRADDNARLVAALREIAPTANSPHSTAALAHQIRQNRP
jgi:histidinol-phosphate/aromatic aminotransferase/cobyric acid decarboxylase-like protein